ARHLPGGLLLPEGGEGLPVGELGWQQPVAAVAVVPGVLDHPFDDLLQTGRGVTDGVADERAEGQRVGPGLDEPGAVCGVLYGVGEDERLLLPVLQVLVAEEGGQGYRQEGGDGRAEEADAVLL